MGIFKHKDKTSSASTSQNPATTSQAPNPTTNDSFNDSTYYSSSNVSSADTQRMSNGNQQKAQGQMPGTTVTTTTTTTTTTVTVGPDGSTHTTSQPYNPSNDPPPQTETTFNPQTHSQQTQNLAPTPRPLQQQNSGYQPSAQNGNTTNLQSQNNGYDSQPYQNDAGVSTAAPNTTTTTMPGFKRGETPPRKPTPQQRTGIAQPPTPTVQAATPLAEMDSGFPPPPQERRNSVTSGGRTIPPRTDFMSQQPRSERRNSRELSAQPLSSQKSNSPTSPNLGAPAPPQKSYDEEVSPVTPVAGTSQTPNFPRPGAPSVPAAAPTAATTTHGTGRRENVMSAFKGLHGAGEALRGTVNSTIAHGMHDSAEEERQRAIRDQGMNEFRGSGLREQASGLREGFRQKAEERNRLRRRSGSAQRQQVGHTLDPVDER